MLLANEWHPPHLRTPPQMLLLLFRRELSWQDTYTFWESLWAAEALARAPLATYAAAALFVAHRRVLLATESLDGVVEWVNRLPEPPRPLDLVADATSLWAWVHAERAAVPRCGCANLC